MDYPHNKELYHHGILGQKWGVRRYQNYDGTRIKTVKNGLSNEVDDIVIRKGTKLDHVTSQRKLKLNKNGSEKQKATFLYREDNTHDKDVFEGAYTKYIEYRDGYGFFSPTIYKHKYTSIDDLVSPSEKKRAEIFCELYREDPLTVSTIVSRVDEYLKEAPNATKELKDLTGKAKWDSKTSDADIKDTGYKLFVNANNWGYSDVERAYDRFYKKVQNKGYNALIDDNDYKRYNFAEQPIIAFNASKTLKEIGVETLSKETMARREESLRNYMEKKTGSREIAL